jgi:hypothetical protein
MRLHVAYNVETGEIISTGKPALLKRMVRNANASAQRWGYPVGKWVFSHGPYAVANIIKRG